jgi:hypothetical protein
MVEILLGQSPNSKKEESIVGKIPDKRTQPPRRICHRSKEKIEVGSVKEKYLVGHHPLYRIGRDPIEEIDGGITIVVKVSATSAEGLKCCSRNGNEHTEDKYISRIREERGECVDDFFHA